MKIAAALVSACCLVPALVRGQSASVPARAAAPDAIARPCPPGTAAYRDGSSAGVQCVASPDCPPGQQRDVRGQCRCPDGGLSYRDGIGDARCSPAAPCPSGTRRDASSEACVCPPGSILYRDGQSAGGARCVAAHGERAAPSLPQPATLQPGRPQDLFP